MRLAKPATIRNEDGTISGHINSLPVDGSVYIITEGRVGETLPEGLKFYTYRVAVDDLNPLSQEVIYELVEQSRSKNNGH